MVGSELRNALITLRMSQREFANKSGVREETVSRWVRDRKPIPRHIEWLVTSLREQAAAP